MIILRYNKCDDGYIEISQPTLASEIFYPLNTTASPRLLPPPKTPLRLTIFLHRGKLDQKKKIKETRKGGKKIKIDLPLPPTNMRVRLYIYISNIFFNYILLYGNKSSFYVCLRVSLSVCVYMCFVYLCTCACMCVC